MSEETNVSLFKTPRRLGGLARSFATPASIILCFVLFFLLACALLGPSLVPYDPLQTDGNAGLEPPSLAHFFGTDQLGRDVFSRVIVATRLDLLLAFTAVLLSLVVGGMLGIVAGWFGGWPDRIVGRLLDTIMAFPLFVLAMGIVAALGNSIPNIAIATAVVNLPYYARHARIEVSQRRNAGYIEAARAAGNRSFRLLAVQMLPNILPSIVVQSALNLGWAILNAAGLSFIGLGVRPPQPEWGIMISEGAGNIVSGEWWLFIFPGIALMIAMSCFLFLGDLLRDLLDPRGRP